MSHSESKTKQISKSKSFPENKCQHKNKTTDETPLCACLKGSYTLEAVIVIPLLSVFLCFFLFFFRVMYVEMAIKEGLMYATRMGSVMAAASKNDKTDLMIAIALFEKEAAKNKTVTGAVKGGLAGILLADSEADGDHIRLRAAYKVKFPINLIAFDGVNLISESVSRKWNGTDGNGTEEDPIVYCAQTGTVYHLTRSCPYLDLSIHTVKASEVAEKRGKNGQKYYKCSRCAAKNSTNSVYYITDYGSNYHELLSCSGLKRTVYEMHLSQVKGRSCCKKCRKKKRKGIEYGNLYESMHSLQFGHQCMAGHQKKTGLSHSDHSFDFYWFFGTVIQI